MRKNCSKSIRQTRKSDIRRMYKEFLDVPNLSEKQADKEMLLISDYAESVHLSGYLDSLIIKHLSSL